MTRVPFPAWEEEIKLSVPCADTLETLLSDPVIVGRLSAPLTDRSYTDCYLDLADHRVLLDRGLALRLRETGGSRFLELKGAGSRGEDGICRRPEWRQGAPAAEPPFVSGALGAGPVTERLRGLLPPDAPLVALFCCRIRRRVVVVRLEGGGELEIACDDGEVRCGPERAVIREVELELRTRDRAAATAFAASLARRHALEPGGHSKFLIGLKLLGWQGSGWG